MAYLLSHTENFDQVNFIKKELENLGFKFNRKSYEYLTTVRLGMNKKVSIQLYI